jgi:hypothetical protein
LTSDAFRGISSRQLETWTWSSTSVLLVSWGWDPSRDGAETFASRRLAAALLEAGARVSVLATNRADQELASGAYNVTVVPTAPFATSRLGLACQMIRTTVPEAEGNWVAGAVQAGRRVLRELPAETIIYGRAMPGASNIVAWHLARATGHPWVAHFSDEWPCEQVLSNGRKWIAPYKWPLFGLWRRRILRDAGALTFTNPDQASAVLTRDAERYRAKSFIATHLGSDACPAGPPPADRFHIVHTGNFYPPGHSSGPLMQGLRLFLQQFPSARPQCQFTQAGWSNGDMAAWAARCDLGDVVRFAGRLPQAELAVLIGSASLLVGVDYARPNSATLLSKLPDYVSARRPILVITAPTSTMGRLFREDGVGMTAHYDSPDEVAASIRAAFEAWKGQRLGTLLPAPAAVESFSRRRVLTELSGAFLTARRAAGWRGAVVPAGSFADATRVPEILPSRAARSGTT